MKKKTKKNKKTVIYNNKSTLLKGSIKTSIKTSMKSVLLEAAKIYFLRPSVGSSGTYESRIRLF